MSIFSLAAAAKILGWIHRSEVIVATYPGFRTYFRSAYFESQERVFRFSQIKKFGCLKKIIIHIPEIFVEGFYESLSVRDKEYFSKISDVHINIMNQNIELMPGRESIALLRKLGRTITQTTAHHRYSNQEICNRYGIPSHFFSVFLNLKVYKRTPFDSAKKVIVLSPDKAPFRSRVIEILKTRLPDYKQVTIENMPFAEYMSLVAHSRFSITFGEGFDGYLIHAAVIGRLCFAVYNDVFFPDSSFMDIGNVYSSSDDMIERIASDIRRLESNKEAYDEIVRRNMCTIDTLYSYDKFLDNQKRFYQGRYDYFPESDVAAIHSR